MSDLFSASQYVLALVVVIALIAVVALAADRFGLTGMARTGITGRLAGRRARRLNIEEILPLDGRRRLVLVRRDQVEHLILLGTNTETVVERGPFAGATPDTVAARLQGDKA